MREARSSRRYRTAHVTGKKIPVVTEGPSPRSLRRSPTAVRSCTPSKTAPRTSAAAATTEVICEVSPGTTTTGQRLLICRVACVPMTQCSLLDAHVALQAQTHPGDTASALCAPTVCGLAAASSSRQMSRPRPVSARATTSGSSARRSRMSARYTCSAAIRAYRSPRVNETAIRSPMSLSGDSGSSADMVMTDPGSFDGGSATILGGHWLLRLLLARRRRSGVCRGLWGARGEGQAGNIHRKTHSTAALREVRGERCVEGSESGVRRSTGASDACATRPMSRTLPVGRREVLRRRAPLVSGR